MGYWYVELSDGKIALITDDPFFHPETLSEPVYGEGSTKVEETLAKISEAIYGEWKDLLEQTDE
ncbi:hypothetical protein [Melghirimyces algeriensis]|uniref:Uncharacterized protein n=1 Tax=Melghirimyces algeriensis TaxID=910412 RepID=A0A521DPT3_9BACL|nr:hypothetical protein [Melghirimyces algeriensis]SMO73622.1 hypothetical protein SAMN06264849_106181 [Melghirimyces algeriensis]